VLGHVLTGRTSREIGELIGLSARTVEFHRANLMTKLGSPSPTDLLIRVKQLGLA
jgi:DNA-binding CsgD family transcriptional regulator